MKNAFAYAFSIAILGNTGNEKIEINKSCGHISTIMRLLTNKDQDLLSYFHKIDESQNVIRGSSQNQILISNYEQEANREKSKVSYP